MWNCGAPGKFADRLAAVAAQFGPAGDHLPQHRRHAGNDQMRQHRIDRRSAAIARNEDRDLL